MAAGRDYTVAVAAVTAGGWLYAWGRGACGQPGHGDIDRRLVPTLVGARAFAGGSAVRCGVGRVRRWAHAGGDARRRPVCVRGCQRN